VATCHAWPADKPAGLRPGGLRSGNGRVPGVPTAWSPRIVRARDDAVARSPVAQWRLVDGKVMLEISRGPQGDAGQGGGGRGAPERWGDGEAAQAASGGGV
jgi:hypothetical protein